MLKLPVIFPLGPALTEYSIKTKVHIHIQVTAVGLRTWLSWFGVCLIAVKQNDDPGPWFFINSIARPMHLAQLVWVVGFQPVDQGSISVVVKSTQYRGALSQLHNALAAVQLYNSVVRGL